MDWRERLEAGRWVRRWLQPYKLWKMLREEGRTHRKGEVDAGSQMLLTGACRGGELSPGPRPLLRHLLAARASHVAS